MASLSPAKRWVVICSPVSGKKQGRSVVEEQLIPKWKEVAPGLDVGVIYTEYFQHAVEIAREHGSRDCGVVAVGGDGTIHEVIDGLEAKGVLSETPLAMLSQGTMNFYSVTAGLVGAAELPSLLASNSLRPSSLMRVSDNVGLKSVSFEALHIGRMAYRVCMGAREWRFTLGPMFGIFLNLIAGNALPQCFYHSGTLVLHPSDGSPVVKQRGNFFWIIATHRNPYNGCVGQQLWVSYMTLETFPGFGRMMEFFKPPMEHCAGLAYCFGEHHAVKSFEFVNDSASTGLVLDGDACAAGKTVSVEDAPQALRLVAPEAPKRLSDEYYDVPMLSSAAKAWLEAHPAPPGVHSLSPAPPPKPSPVLRLLWRAALLAAIVALVKRRRQS